MERREADRRQRRDYTHKVLQEQRIDAILQGHRINVLHAYPSMHNCLGMQGFVIGYIPSLFEILPLGSR